MLVVASIPNFIPCFSRVGGTQDFALAFSSLSSNIVLESTNPACNQLVACAAKIIYDGCLRALVGPPHGTL